MTWWKLSSTSPKHNPDAAQELKDEIEEKAAKLPDHPKLYKPSLRVKGMRELVARSNYIVPSIGRRQLWWRW